jgi:hypothetical protein
LSDLSSDGEVFAKARSLIVDLNGIASVYECGYKNVNLAGGIISVSADGTRKRAIFEAVSDGLRLGDFVEATGGTAGVKSPTPAELAMKAAYKEEVVSRALHFLSQAKNWVNLYKVLDAMCDDLGSLDAVKKKNWVAAGEIGRFIGTANYHTAAAGEARHGFDYRRGMSDPLTLAEAEVLIRSEKTRTAMPPSAAAVPAEWIMMAILKDTQTRRG